MTGTLHRVAPFPRARPGRRARTGRRAVGPVAAAVTALLAIGPPSATAGPAGSATLPSTTLASRTTPSTTLASTTLTSTTLAGSGLLATRAAGCGPSIDAPLPEQPWPLRRLRPDLVWPVSTGRGVIVAVIDSGVSTDHPALQGQVLDGADLVQNGTRGHCDQVGHGTMVAGIIAAKPIGGSAFTGIAPEARILPIRVLATGDRTFDDEQPKLIATAIRLAVDRGAGVINLSLTTVPVPELSEAVGYALRMNVVVVAAAGNQGQAQGGEPAYPAAYPGVIAVAGINEQGDHVDSSTVGDYVSVAAPGFAIAGPAPQGGGFAMEAQGGTSFAAGYVSGVAALIRANDPTLPAGAVRQRIIATADHPPGGWDRNIGYGVVNPYRAVTAMLADGPAPSRAQQLAVPPATPDPLGRTRQVAVLSAFVAVAVAALLLAGASVARRGRRRGWRPVGR